jgi:hypothetical protein
MEKFCSNGTLVTRNSCDNTSGNRRGRIRRDAKRSSPERLGIESNQYLCNQWHWWAISSNSTKSELVEHLFRRSTILANLAFRSGLVDLDLMDLDHMANFWWNETVFDESGAARAVPNRP